MAVPCQMVLWLLLAPGQPADTPKSSAEDEVKAARMVHMKQAAGGYEITLAGDSAKKLVLSKEPLLRFDDQVTGVVDGAVFVWLSDDRPAAIATIWIRETGHEFHEFQSLATGTLTASIAGQAKWTPAKEGIEPRAVALENTPSSSTVARRKQMQEFAQEHSATVFTSERDRQVLRLLPRPVFQYGRNDGPVADGAIFAFCKGTNPEVLLIVEAVKKGADLEWSFAFARMTSRGCEVRRKNKEVWSVPRVSREPRTDPYFNIVQRYQGPGGK